ncbi:MAG: DUF86 domain-containing protein [Candidatus Cloacimonas sp.]|jgi:uncharacterized protein with HEPN domain|nr:DUF86 domain-containing protein [Candidatus Cloacimonas sp.]
MCDKDKLALLGILDSILQTDIYLADQDSYSDWVKDSKTVDACLMHLINIGEMVNRLSEPFTSANQEIDWYRIRGLRNIIAHDYFGIDYREIWSILTIHVPLLKFHIIQVLS